MKILRRSVVATAVITALLLSACGSPEVAVDPGGEPPPGNPSGPEEPVGCYEPAYPPDDTTGMTPCPEPEEPEGPQRLEPRDDLVDVRPHSWERAEVVGDNERRLDIVFWGGVEDCYGVDRVEVEERPRRIVVTLYTGRLETAEVCIELAVEQFLRVRLDAPARDRRIVDGASEH